MLFIGGFFILIKKRKISFDIADELFTSSENNKYAIINRFKKKNIIINETTFNSSSNPYGKEKGTYCSFVFDHLEDRTNYLTLLKYLKKYLKEFVIELTHKEKPKILFVGLGNESYTPDSLGPRVVKNINSNYFYKNQIGCLIPGVMSQTGMETSDIIKGVLKCHDYDLVIVIDSLATTSIKRLNKTIQITDTGIRPGSGIKNFRKAITFHELKTKVLTIGIATVISYQNLINEFLIDNNIKPIKNNGNQIFLTTKEIEHEIDYLSLILSDVINEII